MQHIISGKQFADRKLLEKILKRASVFESADKKNKVPKLLKDKIVACVFFEPSTRTRLSFETASLKLGAQVISVENALASSSAYKGETLEDTTKIINGYADIFVLRHPESGAAERASKVSKIPVINAGDGAKEHPTQALLDLYTIKKEHKKLENLTLVFVGDLLYSRTIHSLLPLLAEYKNNKFVFVSPSKLALPKEYTKLLEEKGIEFSQSRDLDASLSVADVVYMTRVQKERFESIADYNKVKDLFLLKRTHLKALKKNAIIMHPLPRINEIDPEIDLDPRAAYFRQAKNGLYVRMAVLLESLGL